MLRWLVVLLPLAAWAQTPGGLALFEPPTGCYIGAFIERDPVCQGDVPLFERLAGKKHAVYMTYVGYGRPFPSSWARRLYEREAAAHIGFEPNNGLEAVRDDEYLRTWAKAAHASGIPIFLRFASEMNGSWQAYSGNPSLYVAKWRLLCRVMRELAPNVAMVWCVYSAPASTWRDYYPGDDAVDWVGINLYSVLYSNSNPNQPVARRDQREELRGFYRAFADRKPVMVGEYAASSWCQVVNGPTVDFAVEKMTSFYQSLPAQFPRVKAIQWFSVDTVTEGVAANNYALTQEPALLGRYRELTGGDYWRSRVLGEFREPAPEPPPAPRPVIVPPPVLGLADLAPGTVIQGETTLQAFMPEEWDVRFVSFQVNGRTVFSTNREPYRCRWDPSSLEPGRYELAVKIMHDADQVTVSPAVPVEVRRPS